MGLESLSRRNLGENQKRFNNPANFRQVVQRLHERKISLQGCFVFGLDDDTPEVFLETARFAVEAGIDLPRFAIVTPFPGTKLYNQLESEGRILTRNWELYDGQHVVFQPAGMSVGALQQGNEMAWKYAYSWSGIARRLRRSPASWSLGLLTNFGYRYYAYRLNKFYHCDWSSDRPAPSRSELPIASTLSLETDNRMALGAKAVPISTAPEPES